MIHLIRFVNLKTLRDDSFNSICKSKTLRDDSFIRFVNLKDDLRDDSFNSICKSKTLRDDSFNSFDL